MFAIRDLRKEQEDPGLKGTEYRSRQGKYDHQEEERGNLKTLKIPVRRNEKSSKKVLKIETMSNRVQQQSQNPYETF